MNEIKELAANMGPIEESVTIEGNESGGTTITTTFNGVTEVDVYPGHSSYPSGTLFEAGTVKRVNDEDTETKNKPSPSSTLR